MVFFILLAAYLLGAIPFGYIFARLIGKTDIREHGSGNIGATNILRVMGWKVALPVFVLDLLKGFAAVFLAKAVGGQPILQLAAGMLAMLGHSFPVFIGFKGGKAAATASGVLLAISGWVTLALFASAVLVLALTGYVSLASITGSLLLPLYFWIFGFEPVYIYFGLAAALLIIVRHQANIKRLLNGNESKLNLRRKLQR
jgi:acyl phosphate:glycerol-3-phosphate acyltransferase